MFLSGSIELSGRQTSDAPSKEILCRETESKSQIGGRRQEKDLPDTELHLSNKCQGINKYFR